MQMVTVIFVFLFFLFSPAFLMAEELIFAGDVTLARNISSDQRKFFEKKTRERIGRASLFLWNAEFSGLSDTLKNNRFVFSTDSDIAKYMKFPNGIAMIANNHAFDGKEKGFANLVKSLIDHRMPYAGLRNFESAHNFLTVVSGGRKYYILNFSPMVEPHPMPFATARYGDVKASLRFLKTVKNDSDRIIVYVHDGIENRSGISQRQKDTARELSALGADIVAFAHSHAYADPEKTGDTLILWGLGNFIFGGNLKWCNHNDVRLVSVDPETLEWRWLKGKTREYVFSLKEE